MYILITPRLKLMTDKINRENLCALPVQLYHSFTMCNHMTFVRSRTQISVGEEWFSSTNIISCRHNFEIERRIPRILTRLIRARLPNQVIRCKLLNIRIHPFAEAQVLAYNYFIYTRRAAFQAWIRFQRENSKVLLRRWKKKNNNFALKYVGWGITSM